MLKGRYLVERKVFRDSLLLEFPGCSKILGIDSAEEFSVVGISLLYCALVAVGRFEAARGPEGETMSLIEGESRSWRPKCSGRIFRGVLSGVNCDSFLAMGPPSYQFAAFSTCFAQPKTRNVEMSK